MSAPRNCPTCGAQLASDSPGAACPKCLLLAGFATGGASAAERATTPEELAPKFPGLAIERVLGRGGMGVVYKARHKALDRDVALKVLPSSVAGEKAFAERFQREARALAKLQHPNIVAVHDFGMTDGLFWLVMEYVEGANIRQAMRAGQIAPKDALAIVPQICDALQYAHEHGVVHRDIKPENVLLDKSGRVKVADFGLAKLMAHDAADLTLTGAGQVMGTPHYMAPEQVEHPADVDHRADIYSLGVVFYEMLTGELPLGRFAAPSAKSTVDARIDEIVMRTLEKEREARYQRVVEVKTDVGRVAEGRAPTATATPARGRLSKLAVAACAAIPVAVATVVVAAATNPPLNSFGSYAIGAAFWVLVFAWIASVASWIRIARSKDRLRGRAWAIAGTFLPLAAVCVAALGYVFLPLKDRAGGVTVETDEARKQRELARAREFYFSSKAPEIDESFERGQIQALWTRLAGALRGGNRETLADLYLPEDALLLRLRDDAELARGGAAGEIGFPFYARQTLATPRPDGDVIGGYWLKSGEVLEVVNPVGSAPRVARVALTATDGKSWIRFLVRGRIKDDERGRTVDWYFDNGRVTVGKR